MKALQRVFVISIVLLLLLVGFALPQAAAQDPPGACISAGVQGLSGLSAEGTLGDFVSDGYYGNEPNILPFDSGSNQGPEQTEPGSIGGGNSGHPNSVVGSSAPGPWTSDAPAPGEKSHDFGDGPRAFGTTWGEALTSICNP